MARRTTRTKPKTAEAPKAPAVDDEVKSIDQVMIEKIMANIALDTLAFECPNIFQAATKTVNGSYRTTSIEPNTDFALIGMRLGGRGQVIFEFKPIEPTPEFVQLELDETKVFKTFEGLESMVVQALGYLAAPKVAGEHWGETAYDWPGAKQRFHGEEKRRRRDVATKEVMEKAKREIEEKKKVADAYESNPLFGSW